MRDLLSNGIECVEGAEAGRTPRFEMWEELLEKVESLQNGPALIATQVEDELGFAGTFSQAKELLSRPLEIGLLGTTVAGDKVGDAEDGDCLVG